MYQIRHKNEHVLTVVGDRLEIRRPDKLPFDLRHYNPPGYREFLAWLNRRLSTLHRTYMNKLYMQRRVGRSHADIINDSAAISIVDQFWVTREDLAHTWESLQVLRDESLVVVKVCLDGAVDTKTMFQAKNDHTSVFSIKGAFEKAPYKGYILKKGNNAEYEISAYNIATHLGVGVAEAKPWDDAGAVACKIFTDDSSSLVHALELLYPFDAPTHADKYTKALETFRSDERLTKQLQRLFLLNYLVANHDFHEENFGFIYDTGTFEIKAVAPAFDFNSAFLGDGSDPLVYDPTIVPLLGEFMKNNADLIPGLKTIEKVLTEDIYLNDIQKSDIYLRASYLIDIATTQPEPQDSTCFQ